MWTINYYVGGAIPFVICAFSIIVIKCICLAIMAICLWSLKYPDAVTFICLQIMGLFSWLALLGHYALDMAMGKQFYIFRIDWQQGNLCRILGSQVLFYTDCPIMTLAVVVLFSTYIFGHMVKLHLSWMIIGCLIFGGFQTLQLQYNNTLLDDILSCGLIDWLINFIEDSSMYKGTGVRLSKRHFIHPREKIYTKGYDMMWWVQ